MIRTDELREMYLAYFESQGHARQPSDVLVPTWDPSVLFTPAGMNQFKDHFLGKVQLDFTRATTCQKCLRTGDIENVGRTAYHHTFFEMMGNFSFGDYFKNEAIQWAWEFLTSDKWLGIESDRLTVTVYKDDAEAAKIWNEKIGLPTSRISWMEEDENFWPASAPSQGPDGVCGPCSEIYYQLDNGKDVEIWNLVFTQFNRVGDPPNNLHPLPSKNIDTGMGLERTASVLQNVPTNYHIDILLPIVKAAAEVCGTKYEYDSDNGRRLRRITDHVRACTFSIHENVYPGAKKAPYVIKRLVRRAVLDGHQMGLREPFLYQLVPTVAEQMKAAYPELSETVERVAKVLSKEEADFFNTIDAGLERIEGVFDDLKRDGQEMVDGREAANLYQTYGVPPELFQSMAAEQSYTFDWDGYTEAMREHEVVSGSGQKALFQTGPIETLKEVVKRTEFVGYEKTESIASISGIVVGGNADDQLLTSANASEFGDQPFRVVLDQSPFYSESGGQVGDTGTIKGQDFEFAVTDTQRAGELIVHLGKLVSGTMSQGASVTAAVTDPRRSAIRRAHSATHILHHALQTTLGSHAQQKGSKVEADALRFDFSNLQPMSDQQLIGVEAIVKQCIARAASIASDIVPLATARAAGAMMLFGEKYPDPVRMVSMGDFSKELCGGTHLSNTEQIGDFEILAEDGVAAGIRRISALTGQLATKHRTNLLEIAQQCSRLLDVSAASVGPAADSLMQDIRNLKKAVANNSAAPEPVESPQTDREPNVDYPVAKSQLRLASRALNVPLSEVASRVESLLAEREELRGALKKLADSGKLSVDDLLADSQMVGSVRCIVAATPGANSNMMRQWIDQIRQKSSEPTAIMLASDSGDGKVLLVCGLSRDLVQQKLSAGNWIRPVAAIVGGGGGGKPDLAQAGGKDATKIPAALEKAIAVCQEMFA
jgi:alanyl-tRNA synthetase